MLSSPESVYTFLEDPDYPEVDIDKSWHVIHHALTGRVWDGEGPEAFLLSGGETVGEEDLGYGPGRIFGPEEVEEIARKLSKITRSELYAAGASEKASELYGGWSGELTDEELAYLDHHLTSLKSFVAESGGGALLVYTS